MKERRRRSLNNRNRTLEQKEVANQRERRRMESIYNGFEQLRHHLPLEQFTVTPHKVTRLQLLKFALDYIKDLEWILELSKFVNHIEPAIKQEIN